MAQASAVRVQKYLAGVDYPASKDELCEHAEQSGASREVLETLRRIPEGDYADSDKVNEAVTGP